MKIYDRFIELLIEANDESVTHYEHIRRVDFLYGWKHGVEEARKSAGLIEVYLNGDHYYMDLGIDRPMCCGLFLDWGVSKPEVALK